MQYVAAIVAGLVGTGVLTALMQYAMPMMGQPSMDMPGMLGSMVTEDEGQAKMMGWGIHLAMGAVFGILYVWLWGQGLGFLSGPWWQTGLITGALHGVVAALAMPMLMSMRPGATEMKNDAMSMVSKVVGHAVFGLVVALVYTQMAG